MPTWRPRKRARPSSSRALKEVPLITTSPLSGRSRPAITISSVDLPEPDAPTSPIASPEATRRLISLRMCTRAAPWPSERLMLAIEMESGVPLVEEGADEEVMRVSMPRSYGDCFAVVERRARMFLSACLGLVMIVLMSSLPAGAQTGKPVRIVVLGDSLTAGLGLPAQSTFPVKLQSSLKNKGIDAEISNAGVSGDTSSGGRDRLDWSVPDGTDAVILELGANDALRGIDPKLTRDALEDILKRLKARNIAVLLCGMLAPPNYGADYAARFNAIYPELAKQYGVPLYPFFLDGVAAEATLNQADGMHPTAQGVDVIVSRILPSVEALLATIKTKGG